MGRRALEGPDGKKGTIRALEGPDGQKGTIRALEGHQTGRRALSGY